MLCGSVAGGSGSGNARRTCCPAPKSGDREGRRRAQLVNVTMPPADRAQQKAPTRQTAGRRRWGDGYASARQYPRASFGGKVLRGLLGATPLGIGKHRAWVGSETTQPPPCRIKLPRPDLRLARPARRPAPVEIYYRFVSHGSRSPI
jgi:hypothetical protein